MTNALWLLTFAICFSLLNRARGSKFFDLTTSTTFSRIISTNGMGLLVGLMTHSLGAALATWLLLFLWSIPEWGKYMGAAVGNPIDKNEKGFLLSEMAVTASKVVNTRIKGLIGTAVRMALAAPALVAVAIITDGAWWPGLLTPLMAAPYSILGLFIPAGPAWKYGEYCAGAILGVLLFLSVG